MPSALAFKSSGMNWSDQTIRGQDFTRIAGQGLKHDGTGWRSTGTMASTNRMVAGPRNGNARKAASAMIAKIPEPLARHIARVYRL